MKVRTNIRNTFWVNGKVDDLLKNNFKLQVEKNSDNINDIKVNYEYYDYYDYYDVNDDLKVENRINLVKDDKDEDWLYEGIMTAGYHTELLFGSVLFEIFGYSENVTSVQPMLSEVSIGNIDPIFNISICTEPSGDMCKLSVVGLTDAEKDVILKVNDIEYSLLYLDSFGNYTNSLMLTGNIFEDGVDYEIKIRLV